MQNTKIEWATKVWNVLTGCLNNCPYCYARQIAKRFGGHYSEIMDGNGTGSAYNPPHLLLAPMEKETKKGFSRASFPYGFEPTFHKYRCNVGSLTSRTKENVFVCSMSDLFHRDIPTEWILEVMETAKKTRHNFLFLTKNPMRYYELFGSSTNRGLPASNFWLGATITDAKSLRSYEIAMNYLQPHNLPCKFFVSFEPLMQRLKLPESRLDWVIVGMETGNRKDKSFTLPEWVRDIYIQCKNRNIPIFLKNNLEQSRKDIMFGGKPLSVLPQEMPIELLLNREIL